MKRFEPIRVAPCGCKRYVDGTRYLCLSHRYPTVTITHLTPPAAAATVAGPTRD